MDIDSKSDQLVQSLLEAVTLRGKTFTLPRPGDRMVTVKVGPFNAAWSRDHNYYVGPGGSGAAIGDRYQRFGQWLADHDHVQAPYVDIGSKGDIYFSNGRHRYAWLRDHGWTVIPMSMNDESIANAQKFGYI